MMLLDYTDPIWPFGVFLFILYHLNWLLCAVVGVLALLHLTASLTLWSWPKRPGRRPLAAGHKQASYGSSPEPGLRDREERRKSGRKHQGPLI